MLLKHFPSSDRVKYILVRFRLQNWKWTHQIWEGIPPPSIHFQELNSTNRLGRDWKLTFIETKRTLFDLERDSSEDMMGCDIIHELGSIGQRRQGNPRTASCFPCYRCYSSARTRTSDQTWPNDSATTGDFATYVHIFMKLTLSVSL